MLQKVEQKQQLLFISWRVVLTFKLWREVYFISGKAHETDFTRPGLAQRTQAFVTRLQKPIGSV